MTTPTTHPPAGGGFLAAAGMSLTTTETASAPGMAGGTAPQVKMIARNERGEKTYLLVFDKGQEVMRGLLAFAGEHHLGGGYVTGIGTFRDATLGYCDLAREDYPRVQRKEQAEVLSLIGDLALKEGRPFFHIHTVLSLPDGSTRAGCLFAATVDPTLELIFTESRRPIQRKEE
jgi:predicted DNA-binding protein with PD1-like motif